MSKPNYRQLRAEIQGLSRARGLARKASERRDDAWRHFYDEDATEDGFLLEDDETEFSVEAEEEAPFAESPRRLVSRPITASERHTRALQKIAQLVDESHYGLGRSRGLDQALDALSRSISASERRAARALETIVAELIDEDFGPPPTARRRKLSRRAPPAGAPQRDRATERDQCVDETHRAHEDELPSDDNAPKDRDAESQSSVVKLPLAEAVLDITRRQSASDVDAQPQDQDEPSDRAAAGYGPRRLFGEVDALAREIGALRENVDCSAEREKQIMLQLDGLRAEIRGLTRDVGALAPRASVEAIEGALAELAARVDAQRDRGVEDKALAPAERIAGELRAVLQEIDPRPHMRELEADIRRLSDRLEAAGEADEASLQALAQRTSEIKESLSALAGRPLPLERIEASLRDLTRRVDALACGPAPEERHRDLLETAKAIRAILSAETGSDAFNQRLDRLSAELEEALARFNGDRFEALGARIDEMHQSLAQRIDQGISQASPNVASLEGLLANLADKVGQALSLGEAPRAGASLEDKVSRLDEKLDRLGPAALAQQLAELLAKAKPHEDGRLAEIGERLDAMQRTLAAQVDENARCRKDESHKAQLSALLEQLANRSAEACGPGADSAAVNALSEQVRQLSARLDKSLNGGATLASIERKIAELCEKIENSLSSAAGWPGTSAQRQLDDRAEAQDYDESALVDDGAAPRFEPYAAHFEAHQEATPQDISDSGSRAAVSVRAVGVDLELRRQAEFIAAARRAAERAGAEDRRASAGDREASQAPRVFKETKTPAAPSRKALILAALTGVALLLAAAPIGRTVFDQTRTAPSNSVALQPPSSLTPKFSPPLSGPSGEKPGDEGADVAAASVPNETPTAKPEPKTFAAAALDRTPVGAIEKPQEIAPLQAAAERGDARAQYELGVRYAEGRGGLPRDLKLAAQWFAKAAEQGVATAQYRLGSLYEKGMGVERSPERARSLYEKAASAGSARAMHNLGVLFVENGDGLPDYASAAAWFRKAAEYGVRDSQFNLAVLYARGMGVEQNLTQSYMWFAVAAAQGDLEAAKKRDEVAARLDARGLATAKSMAEAFKPKDLARDVNESEPPRSAGPSLNPSAKPDGPTAGLSFLHPKRLGL
jgi:localization factor PodJL